MATDIETETDEAISKVLSVGQNFTVDGLSHAEANLDAMIRLKKDNRLVAGRTDGTRPIFSRVNANLAAY